MLEITKYCFGQNIIDTSFNIVFYTIIVTSITHNMIKKMINVLITWIQLFEVGTWYYYNMPINKSGSSSDRYQFINSSISENGNI